MKRKILRIALILALLMSLAFARADAFDLSRTGTIALEMKDASGRAIAGGVFRLYRVGDAAVRDNNLIFDLTAEFAGSGANLDDLSRPELAASLAEYAGAHDLPCTEQAADAEGRALFENISCGLYLAVQKAPESDYGYERMAAFLVSIPMTENGELTYAVTARPKAEKNLPVTPAPQPTPPPDEPNLPQTGLPRALAMSMAASGLVLFVIGWVLFFSRKRHG